MRPSRSLVLRAVAAGAALALTACWPSPDQNPDRTSYNPSETRITQATVANLTESWVAPLDDEGGGTPVVSTSRVHVVAGPWAYGFDIGSGRRVWKSSAIGDPSAHGLVQEVSPNAFVRNGELMTSGGRTFIGGSWWTTYLDATTGELLRTDQPEGLVDGVREPNTSGTRLGLRTDDSPEEWLVVGGPGGRTARLYYQWNAGRTRTTIGPDAVYAAGTSLIPPVTTVETPGGPVHVWAGFGLGVRRFPKDVVEGCTTEAWLNFPQFGFACPDWIATLDGTLATAPVLDPSGPALFVTTAGGNLYALDRGDGSVLWSAALGSAGGQPALADGRLYVPTTSNGLQVFDAAGCGAATCTPEWTIAQGGTPSVAGDVLYLGGGPTIRAYPADGCGAATCDPLWSADAGGTAGKVVVTRGRAYVSVSGRGLVTYTLST